MLAFILMGLDIFGWDVENFHKGKAYFLKCTLLVWPHIKISYK